MLSKNDLQMIAAIIDERLEIKLEEKLESKLEEKLDTKFEEKLSPINTQLKTMNRKLNRVIKDVAWMSKTFDGELSDVRKRVDVLERNVGIN